ncbi:hypothetical protein HanXRQr2_Chr12g0550451 [Helianthus annuus]|uniref:Uncharacterized protein n=1 Tax=Helianthus annuus TaxID=4232 RepID=A0A9K3HI82_HELAN|nr:hypothetical protein HanXRQr2_Chr12g0550451 [Helianthus annuus]KAJ0863437.1 hypothetical protein HanPSC8_Chr12g0530001 [Helianthus annuus]
MSSSTVMVIVGDLHLFWIIVISNTTALHSNSQELYAITQFCTIVILVPSLLSSRFVNLVCLI